MARELKKQTGRFLAPQDMAAFKGASVGSGGLCSPVSETMLRRLDGKVLKSAVLTLGSGSGPRTVVLLLQFGRVQFAGLVPVVDTLTQHWLLDGVEVHHRLQWVVQSPTRYRVLSSRAPIADPLSPDWQLMRAKLEQAPLGASAQEQAAALDEALGVLQAYPLDLQPGAGALQQWAVVCRHSLRAAEHVAEGLAAAQSAPAA